MSLSRKYSRTMHYPFSPGTTSDDRINFDYWEDLQEIDHLIHTEKLDGENTCLNQYGVFARSHAAPTRHPWANYLKEKWHLIKAELKNLEIFGENLYAIHSIKYTDLEQHFYVFAIREFDQWLSWEEVQFYAALLDLPVVPMIEGEEKAQNRADFRVAVESLAKQPSAFGSVDALEETPCSMEGIVSRNTAAFSTEDFQKNVFKYVRANHVKTDTHWRRNWRRAPLKWERNVDLNE